MISRLPVREAPAKAPARPARPGRRVVPVLGIDIDAVTEADAVERIVRSAAAGRGGRVMTPNLDMLRQATHNGGRKHLEGAELVVADGMPVVWASRLAGTPVPERVAGSDLIWTVSEAAARRGLSVFLLGGNPGAAEDAGRRLVERYPGLRLAGTHFPPFGFDRDPDAMREVERAVAAARPDIVFVGLPFPLQAVVAEHLAERLPRSWFLCVGVSFSFVTGEIRRAPRWIRRVGAEWLWRLSQEPRRLADRYLVHGIPFAFRLFGWALGRRLASPPPSRKPYVSVPRGHGAGTPDQD